MNKLKEFTKSVDLINPIEKYLAKADLNKLSSWERADLLNAAAQLIGAGKQNDLKDTDKLCDTFIKRVDEILASGLDSENVMLGNALYLAKAFTGEDKYETAAVTLADRFKNMERSPKGFFFTSEGKECLCSAYENLSFYMNYETKNGGKEHYNDVCAQYNSLAAAFLRERESSFDVSKIYFTAAAIDTMEVMDQALYEIFGKIRDYYKLAVNDIKENLVNKKSVDEFDNKSAVLLYAYAILKGCRMKAIHTEKYENIVDAVVEDAITKINVIDDETTKSGYVAALTLCMAEAVKNREYQDYGRTRGGVLWN